MVRQMKAEGFTRFSVTAHTCLLGIKSPLSCVEERHCLQEIGVANTGDDARLRISQSIRVSESFMPTLFVIVSVRKRLPRVLHGTWVSLYPTTGTERLSEANPVVGGGDGFEVCHIEQTPQLRTC